MEYKFDNILPFESFKKEATYLVLFHVDKLPPHLGIIKSNKYYSITIKETEIGISDKIILGVIKRKKIPTLILEVEDNLKDINSFYLQYQDLKGGNTSCLTPIKEYFACQNKFNKNEIKVVFDLLDELGDKVLNKYQLNLESEININQGFAMKRYNYGELQLHLETLRNMENV